MPDRKCIHLYVPTDAAVGAGLYRNRCHLFDDSSGDRLLYPSEIRAHGFLRAAFYDYKLRLGFEGSKYVGSEVLLERCFTNPNLLNYIGNT